jgi:predicted RNA binding protein YcfA (HicA-like mRNA interferase family)
MVVTVTVQPGKDVPQGTLGAILCSAGREEDEKEQHS